MSFNYTGRVVREAAEDQARLYVHDGVELCL